MIKRKILILILLRCIGLTHAPAQDGIPGVTKIQDIVIYEDTMFYSSFPSVVKRPDGEILAAFRRAPERKKFGEKGTSHTDPNSYLVMIRSRDGVSWPKEPELLYAYPFGGSQDPCLLQLKDGTLLCTSYGWAFVKEDGIQNMKKPFSKAGDAIFLGGYILRSSDGGKKWFGPYYPPHIDPEINYDAFGKPVPAYNRGALYEAKDGRILWVVAAGVSGNKVSDHLIVSKDKGQTWTYSGQVASDSVISFNEASVYETPKGDIVAFLRSADFGDTACIARSHDKGRTFNWEPMGFQGHPLNALRLPDNRVLLTYGYRHKPYGIRCRILNSECTDFSGSPEMILRDDGGNSDIGYTWPVMLDNERVLIAYYFNKADGTRHIAGTILKIK